MKQIMKCKSCSIFTMREICPNCGCKTIHPIPPKYSPLDKYAKYRRISKTEERREEGLL